jgi:hypothetical protein
VSQAKVFGDNYFQAATNIAQAILHDCKDPSVINFVALHISYQ